ncbi:unnamed protein product [Haemonchus placei]|uniref:Peptidase_M24 domain-containing protein n=1 Tax=Haemonchus placei TaxID=6290 RepID=A0A0N4WV04_HAEPC|nr:unnamed protein product [Haemonchus placei]
MGSGCRGNRPRVPGCECQNCACAVARTHPSPVMRPADRSAIVPLAVVHPVAAPSYISSPTPRDPFSQLGNSYTLHSNPPESPFYTPATGAIRTVESRVFEPEPPSYQESRKPSAHLTQSQIQESAVAEHSPLPPAYEPTQLPPHDQKNILVTASGYIAERPNLIRAPAVPPSQDVGMTNKGITSLSSRGSAYQETFVPVMRMNETTASPPQMADQHPKTYSLGKVGTAGIADSRYGMQSGQIQECSGLMVRMVHGKSIVAATEECLKIGCEAINAQSLPDYAYMVRDRPDCEKDEFYVCLDEAVSSVSEGDYLTIAGDLNGHVGIEWIGLEKVQEVEKKESETIGHGLVACPSLNG